MVASRRRRPWRVSKPEPMRWRWLARRAARLLQRERASLPGSRCRVPMRAALPGWRVAGSAPQPRRAGAERMTASPAVPIPPPARIQPCHSGIAPRTAPIPTAVAPSRPGFPRPRARAVTQPLAGWPDSIAGHAPALERVVRRLRQAGRRGLRAWRLAPGGRWARAGARKGVWAGVRARSARRHRPARAAPACAARSPVPTTPPSGPSPIGPLGSGGGRVSAVGFAACAHCAARFDACPRGAPGRGRDVADAQAHGLGRRTPRTTRS